MSIGDLADAVGVSRRAVRFYVQQKLLQAPLGRGRGNHYDASHLARLRQILDLQSAGHSLDAIRRILDGEAVPPPSQPARPRPLMAAELWTRLRLADGVELSFDSHKYQPTVEELLQLRELANRIFQTQAETQPETHDERD